MQLRDYQSRMVREVREEFAAGHRAVCLQAPTGAGKTVILAYISRGVLAKGHRAAITVHRQELLSQTSLTLAQWKMPHALIAPGAQAQALVRAHIQEFGRSYVRQSAPLSVASIATLGRLIGTPRQPRLDFLLIDEAHHSVAGTWARTLGAYPDAWVLGVTATPERKDGRGLGVEHGGPYQALVHGPQVAELVAAGYLSPSRVYAPPMQADLTGLRTRMGDFDASQAADALDRPTITGDAVEHYRRLASGAPAIAFCVSVKHAEHVADAFRAAGYRAASVDGGMPGSQRRQAIRDLGTGSLNVLTSCDIISEGTDVPIVSAAILLRPTQSEPLFRQQVGRALRPYPGKEYALVLDHVGNTLRHGLPDDHRIWTLSGQKKKRRSRTAADDHPGVRTCSDCFAIYHATRPKCPQCGTPYAGTLREIREVDGELAEINREEFAERKRALAQQQRIERARARSLDDLIRLGKERGYRNPRAWAEHVVSARRREAGRARAR